LPSTITFSIPTCRASWQRSKGCCTSSSSTSGILTSCTISFSFVRLSGSVASCGRRVMVW